MKKSLILIFVLVLLVSTIQAQQSYPSTGITIGGTSNWYWHIYRAGSGSFNQSLLFAQTGSSSTETIRARLTQWGGLSLGTTTIAGTDMLSVNGNTLITGNLDNKGTLYLNNVANQAGLKFLFDNTTTNNGSDVDLTIKTNSGAPIVDWYIKNWYGTYIFNRGTNDGNGGTIRKELFKIQGNGNIIVPDGGVGIGTTNPEAHLHVEGGEEDLNLMLKSDNTFNSTLRLSEIQTQQGGYVKNQGDGNLFHIGTSYSSTDSDIITIPYSGNNSGNVGIGTTTPQSKLAVNGTIRSKEVKVEANGWPDYVFAPDYNLRTLKETKKYITENKHLPEIPSASEIGENGIDLGDMNMRLLKKIEELTLYQIELLERLEKAEGKISKLEEK